MAPPAGSSNGSSTDTPPPAQPTTAPSGTTTPTDISSWDKFQTYVTQMKNSATADAKGAWDTISTNAKEYYDSGKSLVIGQDGKLDLSPLGDLAKEKGKDAVDALNAAGTELANDGRALYHVVAPKAEGVGGFLKDNAAGIGAGILALIVGMSMGEMGIIGALLLALLAFAVVGGMMDKNGFIGQLFGGGDKKQQGGGDGVDHSHDGPGGPAQNVSLKLDVDPKDKTKVSTDVGQVKDTNYDLILKGTSDGKTATIQQSVLRDRTTGAEILVDDYSQHNPPIAVAINTDGTIQVATATRDQMLTEAGTYAAQYKASSGSGQSTNTPPQPTIQDDKGNPVGATDTQVTLLDQNNKKVTVTMHLDGDKLVPTQFAYPTADGTPGKPVAIQGDASIPVAGFDPSKPLAGDNKLALAIVTSTAAAAKAAATPPAPDQKVLIDAATGKLVGADDKGNIKLEMKDKDNHAIEVIASLAPDGKSLAISQYSPVGSDGKLGTAVDVSGSNITIPIAGFDPNKPLTADNSLSKAIDKVHYDSINRGGASFMDDNSTVSFFVDKDGTRVNVPLGDNGKPTGPVAPGTMRVTGHVVSNQDFQVDSVAIAGMDGKFGEYRAAQKPGSKQMAPMLQDEVIPNGVNLTYKHGTGGTLVVDLNDPQNRAAITDDAHSLRNFAQPHYDQEAHARQQAWDNANAIAQQNAALAHATEVQQLRQHPQVSFSNVTQVDQKGQPNEYGSNFRGVMSLRYVNETTGQIEQMDNVRVEFKRNSYTEDHGTLVVHQHGQKDITINNVPLKDNSPNTPFTNDYSLDGGTLSTALFHTAKNGQKIPTQIAQTDFEKAVLAQVVPQAEQMEIAKQHQLPAAQKDKALAQNMPN